MSRSRRKATKWIVRLVNTQISMGICPVWSLCDQWVARDPMFLHADSEDWSDWADTQADLTRLGRCPGWSESSLCTQVILLVLSCWGSYVTRTLYTWVSPKTFNKKITNTNSLQIHWKFWFNQTPWKLEQEWKISDSKRHQHQLWIPLQETINALVSYQGLLFLSCLLPIKVGSKFGSPFLLWRGIVSPSSVLLPINWRLSWSKSTSCMFSFSYWITLGRYW